MAAAIEKAFKRVGHRRLQLCLYPRRGSGPSMLLGGEPGGLPLGRATASLGKRLNFLACDATFVPLLGTEPQVLGDPNNPPGSAGKAAVGLKLDPPFPSLASQSAALKRGSSPLACNHIPAPSATSQTFRPLTKNRPQESSFPSLGSPPEHLPRGFPL
ncbi:hypothetical protein E2320_012277, partial [Naja naja]